MPVFIALMLRNSRLEELGKVFKYLGYTPIPQYNQHLTLVFVGDVDSYHLHVIRKTLSQKLFNCPRILKLLDIILLPPTKATNIAIEVENSKELNELRDNILSLVNNIVKIKDRYSFLPHITIARRLRPLPSELLDEVISIIRRIKKKIPRYIHVRGLALVNSVCGRYNIEQWMCESLI